MNSAWECDREAAGQELRTGRSKLLNSREVERFVVREENRKAWGVRGERYWGGENGKRRLRE